MITLPHVKKSKNPERMSDKTVYFLFTPTLIFTDDDFLVNANHINRLNINDDDNDDEEEDSEEEENSDSNEDDEDEESDDE